MKELQREGNLMADQDVKLLGFWVSPFSYRVKWALRLKGVEYEYTEEDIYNKSSLLLELNPVTKKIPVLVHNNKALAESLIILEYIDEVWKESPIFPQDPYERATACFWAKVADEKVLVGSFWAMCSNGEKKEKHIQEVTDVMEKLEEQLKGKNFFGGESIGYLDLALGWISTWLPIWEEIGSMNIVDPLKFPAITAWTEKFSNHPAIKDKSPPKDKMIAYTEERKRIYSASEN